MRKKFDVVVIGTGSAASTVAHECRSAGWEVAIIDSRPFGGTCALRGCDPKKVLVGAAEVIDWIRRMKGRGIRADDSQIEWPELVRFKRSFTDAVPKNTEMSFAKAGIAAFHGRARFVDSTAIEVGEDVLDGRVTVIATGAMPRRLGIPGEEHFTRSDQFLELEKLPGRVLFIGGGYISFEFAHIAARSGAEVTILHQGKRPLEGFDPDLVNQLVGRTKRLGVRVELGLQVAAIEKFNDKLSVHTSGDGRQEVFEADLVVHGAGRVPEIADLNLTAAGVQVDERGVRVNDYLQSTSNPAVYAAGDAAGGDLPPLTPVAGYEGRIVASNLLKGNHRKVEHIPVPTVVFTTPPLAAVGHSEQSAHQNGLQFRLNSQETSGWYS
ncbi:MAG: NAD(P)/FAD-dependent oxidoreductase, partial [Acidobacteriota bacterium]|nr:NAD(P)/FAD-dependent oxidoreductase [Acidobacteriota bacterium]